MSDKTVVARGMVPGLASGMALVSRKAFTFAHGVDPSTGDVTDAHSDISGENVKGRVLIYPFGKGSTTASAWFLETVRLGNAPVAVVTEGIDLGVVIGSVLAKALYGKDIPLLSGLGRELFPATGGSKLSVDGTTGRIEVVLT